jgi:hypothetical protein
MRSYAVCYYFNQIKVHRFVSHLADMEGRTVQPMQGFGRKFERKKIYRGLGVGG